MLRRNFEKPYRLLNAKIGCGVQFVLENGAAACGALPALWAQLAAWKRQLSSPWEECSLEAVGTHLSRANGNSLRWGLLLRFIAPEYSNAAILADAVNTVQNWLLQYLRSHWDASAVIDDVLSGYPMWKEGAEEERSISCFLKKAEKINGTSRLLKWYPELVLDRPFPMEKIANSLRRHPGCGLSLEIHALSDAVCREAERIHTTDIECEAWLRKIAEKKAVHARFAAWGEPTFSAEVASAFHQYAIDLVRKDMPFTDSLAHYMVFDPWAFDGCVENGTARLAPSRYTLTCDEMSHLLVPSDEPAKVDAVVNATEEAPFVRPVCVPGVCTRVEEGCIQGTLLEIRDMVAQGLANGQMERAHILSTMNQVYTENQIAHQQLVESLKEMQMECARRQQAIEYMVQKQADARELADEFTKLIPQGTMASFTPDELKWLGAKDEMDLQTKHHLNTDLVCLMRTAFSFARTGMRANAENITLMPFAFPIGALFEYLVRLYFQPRLFDNTPRKKQLTFDESSYQRPKEIPASEFDRNHVEQINAYAKHAKIGGAQYPPFYWDVWLCMFKAIRFSRNKAHINLGDVEMEELIDLYNVMIKPGVQAKVDILKYAYAHQRDDRRLYLKDTLSNYIKQIQENSNWFHESITCFLLLCRCAEWV